MTEQETEHIPQQYWIPALWVLSVPVGVATTIYWDTHPMGIFAFGIMFIIYGYMLVMAVSKLAEKIGGVRLAH